MDIPHSFSVFKSSNPQCIWISHTNKSGTAVKGLLYFIQNTIPKEGYSSTRSIVKFDLIWYQICVLKIAMSTFRRHWFNQPYLPAHYLSIRLFWLDVHLQHHHQHVILEAEVWNSPAAHPRGPRVHTLQAWSTISPPAAASPVPAPPRQAPAPERPRPAGYCCAAAPNVPST